MGRGSYKREVGVVADKILIYTTIFLLILMGAIIVIPILFVVFSGITLMLLTCFIMENVWIVGILALVVLYYFI